MLHIKAISSLVREKDLLRFLPYLGKVAILIMWSGQFEHISFSSTPGGSK